MSWGYCCAHCYRSLEGYDSYHDEHHCFEYTKHKLHPDLYCTECGKQVWVTATQGHAVRQRLTTAGTANDVIDDVIKIIDPRNYSTKYASEIEYDTDHTRYCQLLDLCHTDSSQITEEHCKEHNDLVAKHGRRILNNCCDNKTWDYAEFQAELNTQ